MTRRLKLQTGCRGVARPASLRLTAGEKQREKSSKVKAVTRHEISSDRARVESRPARIALKRVSAQMMKGARSGLQQRGVAAENGAVSLWKGLKRSSVVPPPTQVGSGARQPGDTQDWKAGEADAEQECQNGWTWREVSLSGGGAINVSISWSDAPEAVPVRRCSRREIPAASTEIKCRGGKTAVGDLSIRTARRPSSGVVKPPIGRRAAR